MNPEAYIPALKEYFAHNTFGQYENGIAQVEVSLVQTKRNLFRNPTLIYDVKKTERACISRHIREVTEKKFAQVEAREVKSGLKLKITTENKVLGISFEKQENAHISLDKLFTEE